METTAENNIKSIEKFRSYTHKNKTTLISSRIIDVMSCFCVTNVAIRDTFCRENSDNIFNSLFLQGENCNGFTKEIPIFVSIFHSVYFIRVKRSFAGSVITTLVYIGQSLTSLYETSHGYSGSFSLLGFARHWI